MRTDASRDGLGAVLCQNQDGLIKVIAYASRGLRKAEQNYSSNKLEYLALKWAVTEKYHDHLYGNRCIVRTDNNPLTYVLTTAKLDAVGHRWLAELSTYDLELIYKSGKTNIDADILSRLPETNCHCSAQTVRLLSQSVDPSAWVGCVMTLPVYPRVVNQNADIPRRDDQDIDWEAEQKQDPMLNQVICIKRDSDDRTILPKTPTYRSFFRDWDHLVLQDGVLFHRNSDVESRLVIPEAHKDRALEYLHNNMGHLGRERTIALLRERFYWPGLDKFVRHKLKQCMPCLQGKAPNLLDKAALGHIKATQPMELLSIDYLSLEESKGRYNSILVATDVFTKFAWALPTRNQTAITTAKALYEEIFLPYGYPARIHSDQGRNFEGNVIRQLCKLMGTEKSRTTPYHPMGNPVEQFNRSLLGMLRTLSADQKANWKSEVQSLAHAYNCTINDSTGFSPFHLMFGRKPRLPIDVVFQLGSKQDDLDYVTYIQQLKEHLKQAYELASQRMAALAKANKTRYDKKARGAVPVVGDRVLLRNVSIRGKHKLASKWQDDVFMIVGQVDPSIPVYQIQRESGSGDVKTVHRNLLLPLYLPLDPQITPVLPINKDRARNEEPPTLSLQSDDDDDDLVQIITQRDPDIDVDSSSQHDSYESEVSEESEESDNHEDGNSGHSSGPSTHQGPGGVDGPADFLNTFEMETMCYIPRRETWSNIHLIYINSSLCIRSFWTKTNIF